MNSKIGLPPRFPSTKPPRSCSLRRVIACTWPVWSAVTVVLGAACSGEGGVSEPEGPAPDQPLISEIESNLVTSGYEVSVSNAALWEEAGTTTFKVRLVRQPTASVTLKFAVDNSAEAKVSVSSLTFTTANWSTWQTVTVTGKSDTVVDGVRDLHVVFTDSTSTDTSFKYSRSNPVVPAPLTFYTWDNDVGIVGKRISNPAEGLGGGVVYYRLATQPSANVTVNLSLSDTSKASIDKASLTFTTANWNTWQSAVLTSVNDSVSNSNPSFVVQASAVSGDAAYQGKRRDISAASYDDDQEIVVHATADNPFTCAQGGAAGAVFWTPNTPQGQQRIFAAGMNNDEYVQLKVLHVIMASSYMHTLDQAGIDAEADAFYDATRRLTDASRSSLNFNGSTEVVVSRFWDKASFTSCTVQNVPGQTPVCTPSAFGLNDMLEFSDWPTLKTELVNLGTDPANYDFVMVSLPVDGVGAQTVKDGIWGPNIGGYSIIPRNTPSHTWEEGKVMVGMVRPGKPGTWRLWMHELAHQVEWALERGGSAIMLNPDDPFWWPSFQDEAGGLNWKTREEVILDAYYWLQGMDFKPMTTAAVLPRGKAFTRTSGIRTVVSSCPNGSTIKQKIQ